MATQSDLCFRFAGMEGAAFDVVRFELTEGISWPFRLELELSSDDPDIALDSLLDSDATFTIERDGEPVRTVHGIVTMFEQGETGFRRTRYRAVVEPALARLGLWHGSGIHQQLPVPEILQARLKERGLFARVNASRPHDTREYCVQHRETDLAFFARLAAEEGLAYYFDANAQSRLTLTDVLIGGPALPGSDDIGTVAYQPNPGGDACEPRLWHFALRRQLAPTRAVQRDYTFRNPPYNLEQTANARDAVGEYEHYDAPGRYKRDESGRPFTSTKLQGLRSDATVATLEGDDARLWPGLSFLLEDHPAEAHNRDWRVIAMRHVGEQAASQEEDGALANQGMRYSYTAQAVPGDMEWRPAPLPRPIMDGPQIAHVVGPQNEEIHVDEHGRVMVWFPWDRAGPKENSTCWIRVSQGWAGAGYGMMAIPRIGHEVIVSFLDGDPDQPIVTGRAYHAANRPPYALPQHKTRSTWKSQTHKGEGSNEIRFEDQAGAEEIYVHAQKDQNIVVEHDETTRVGNDRSEDVGNDETIQVGHDRKETVGNDETLSIGQDRRETLGRDHMLEIGRTRQVIIGKDLVENVGNVRIEKTASDRTVETGGHYTHHVHGRHDTEAGQRTTQRTRTLEIHAAEKAIVRGPGGTITIDDAGITIDGFRVELKGPVFVEGGGQKSALSLFSNPTAALPLITDFSEQYLIRHQRTGEPLPDMPYVAETPDGKRYVGRTDANGYTARIHTDQPQQVALRWGREAVAHLRRIGLED